jgi:hypothetical protein
MMTSVVGGPVRAMPPGGSLDRFVSELLKFANVPFLSEAREPMVVKGRCSYFPRVVSPQKQFTVNLNVFGDVMDTV